MKRIAETGGASVLGKGANRGGPRYLQGCPLFKYEASMNQTAW
jgi:hypothetical protein